MTGNDEKLGFYKIVAYFPNNTAFFIFVRNTLYAN
jgi:hypothetical protein